MVVVRRRSGGGLGSGGGAFTSSCGLAPPAPSPPRAAHNYNEHEVQTDSCSHPTQNRTQPPRRRHPLVKRSSSIGRIRRRPEMSTAAITYASDDEHELFDDLSSCGTVSETGRPGLVTDGTCSGSSAAQQPRPSVLDTLLRTFESCYDEDDGHPYPDADHGKRPRVSFYTAIYDTSRGESRAEGTGVRVQRSGGKGTSPACSSPPVSQVLIPTVDAPTIASSGEHSRSRSPQSRVREIVRRISSRTNLGFFGDDDDDSDDDDVLSKHTPLGVVRIVPARRSSLQCTLAKGGSDGDVGGAAARCSSKVPSPSPSPSSHWDRFPSLLVAMGCILLVVSALIATSDVSSLSLPTLLGVHHLPPSALASTYLSLAINEVRYQAFRVASVQCRDLNAIRYDWISAGARLRNRHLLDLDPEERERVLNGDDDDDDDDDDDRAALIMIEKLKREASFVSRQRVEERFGKGPHYIRFYVELGDQQSNDSATTESFVVKMADVSLMPMSVSSFLSQVKHGFWNDKKFDINAGHILLASGESIDAKYEDEANLADLTDLGIASPIFGEYSQLRPHSELTLGFVANRPTPHFYINLQDNEDVHGLHSVQDHHFADGEADPSFADIIDGKDVVRRMVTQVPFFEADGSRPNKNVKIVRAEIDSDYTPLSLR